MPNYEITTTGDPADVPATVNGEVTPAEMLQTAIAKGLGPEQLNQLVTLYERMEAGRALREYAAAIRGFQKECPIVRKTREYAPGREYAPLPTIMREVQPYLDKHDLSITGDVIQDTDGLLTVKTTIWHTAGHRETTTVTVPIDRKSSMNDSQRVGSAISYARRYGLCLALGILTGTDDDGLAAGGGAGGCITEQQAADLEALITEYGLDRARFLAYMKVDQLANIPASKYGVAVDALRAKGKRNERGAR